MTLLFLAAALAAAVPAAAGRDSAYSFDSVWFYRDGTRVVPEISRHWITVVFDPRYGSDANDPESVTDTDDGFIKKKASAIVKSHKRLTGYLHDPNLAEDACFFKVRDGQNIKDIRNLISQLSQDRTVTYVHPAVVLNDRTFAFFNVFEMEWKTGTPRAERESLLRAAHAVLDEKDEKARRYFVNVTAIPYFRALNLLTEDIRVLRVTPRLVEIKPTISPALSLYMGGGNIGDSIPFTLTIAFSDRVNIDPSSIATLNLRPPELQKELFDCTFDPYDYAKAVTQSPIVITGRLKFYAPGEFSIPAIKISYSCPSCSDSSVRSIETEPIPFKVSSIIPKVKSEYRIIVPSDPVPPDLNPDALRQRSRRYLWFAIVSFAGLVPCAAGAFLLRPRFNAERNRLEGVRKADQLAGKLRVLLFSTPTVPHWSYLGEVGNLLREYLVVRFGIGSKYGGGSSSRFMETIGAHIPAECAGSLYGIFSAIDDSVALESEQYQDMARLQRDILDVMELIAHSGTVRG